jgi:hypothetical protein
MSDATPEWAHARFPSRSLREEFLDEVRAWNRVEGLPTIRVEPAACGFELRFASADEPGARRLIDCYGGYVKPAFLRRAAIA